MYGSVNSRSFIMHLAMTKTLWRWFNVPVLWRCFNRSFIPNHWLDPISFTLLCFCFHSAGLPRPGLRLRLWILLFTFPPFILSLPQYWYPPSTRSYQAASLLKVFEWFLVSHRKSTNTCHTGLMIHCSLPCNWSPISFHTTLM